VNEKTITVIHLIFNLFIKFLTPVVQKTISVANSDARQTREILKCAVIDLREIGPYLETFLISRFTRKCNLTNYNASFLGKVSRWTTATSLPRGRPVRRYTVTV